MSKSSSFWSDSVKRRNGKLKEQLVQLLGFNVEEVVLNSVGEYLKCGTRLLLELLMDAEAEQRCGRRYGREEGRTNVRWGRENGTAILTGGKVEVSRPRIRAWRNMNGAGGEVQLETYKAMNREELMDGPLMASILSGVSTRQYAKILSRGLEAKGVSKSAISRKAIAATKPTVEQFRKRSLDQLDLVALLFDGIHIAKKQMIVSIGIDMNGRKHVLGLHLGATESDVVCRDLIRDLVDRGLSCEKEYLFVIDGSTALVKAIHARFGQNTAIQRCQEHKIRDVLAYVPVKRRREVREKMQAAYNQASEKEALKRLAKIRAELAAFSQNAVGAITEGMYETVTVLRLGISGLLRQSLRTTNIIESAFSSVRRYMGRVTKFKDEEQVYLWVTRSLIEAEKHFRVLPGYRQLSSLRDKLLKAKNKQR
jgi:transposase-like protein